MKTASEWRAVLAEVDQARCCAHPVRLRGTVLESATGALVNGEIVVPCKDRRAAVCPSCSRLYQADAWQLVAAGIRGGKGVSTDVVDHPQLFVTLTAPSFGAVHRAGRLGQEAQPCRPRRGDIRCPHGRPLSCLLRHADGDHLVGEPLCPDCFDYRGAVLWNAHVPALWVRTSRELYRELAKVRGISTKELRTQVRLSYMKVVEFQHRGMVHLHLVIRADGHDGPSEPPPPWLDAEALRIGLEGAIGRVSVPMPDGAESGNQRAVWGSQFDIRELIPSTDADSRAIAAYVAKYATKTADGSAWLARPIRSVAQLQRLELRPHVAEMVRVAWSLGQVKELRPLRLRAHAHTLGYPGQFSSKSQRFSTTFAALRDARLIYKKGEPDTMPDFDGDWHYAGRGYDHPEADVLARTLREATVNGVPRFPTTSTDGSTNHSPRP